MFNCNLEEFILEENTFDGYNFAKKIVNASKIANAEPYRAVTNNKGIMNGVDALIIATGNDFRAIEAGAHAYASRSGQYRSLSKAYIENDKFIMELTLPLAVSTVGGLTNLHPWLIGLSTFRKSKCRRTYVNYSFSRFSTKFCSTKITCYNRNSKRAYENAFT